MASPIAHSLAGLSIYWLFKPRTDHKQDSPLFHKRTIAGAFSAVILANISDFDLILGWITQTYLHHQVSHTFAFAIMGGVLGFALAPVFKLPPLRTFGFVTLAIGSHVIIDYLTKDTTTPKGCMIFWPISKEYFIFPVPLFLDIWRMSPKLAFGYNNFNAALHETAVGGLFLVTTHFFHRLPRVVFQIALWSTVTFSIIAIFANNWLTVKAEEQLMEFWGTPVIAPSNQPSTGQHGILFASRRDGDMEIYKIQPDGSELKQLTNDSSENIWPVWSPDGNWIVFQSDRDGNRDIWLMAADGSQSKNLTSHPAMDESPFWTPAGNQIVFSSDRSGQFELYVMNRDGSNPKQMTPPDGGSELLPAVSPVEEQVAYTANKPLMPGWHIYLLSLNGGKPVRISAEQGCRAKWSPDGKYLTFVSDSLDGRTDIYMLETVGKPRLPVVKTPEYDYDPCFSPDGKHICFARGSEKNKGGWDLWIVDLDGTNLRQLTFDHQDNRFPCWR